MGDRLFAFCVGIKNKNIQFVVHFDTLIYHIRSLLAEKKIILLCIFTQTSHTNINHQAHSNYKQPRTQDIDTTRSEYKLLVLCGYQCHHLLLLHLHHYPHVLSIRHKFLFICNLSTVVVQSPSTIPRFLTNINCLSFLTRMYCCT